MKKLCVTLVMSLVYMAVFGQNVGIGTANPQ